MVMLIMTRANAVLKEDLFEPPFLISAKISPDGKWIAYVGSENGGVPNIFVGVKEGSRVSGEQVSFFMTPGIIQFFWSSDSKRVLVTKDEQGKGKLNLHSIDVYSKEDINYTEQFENVNAKLIHVSTLMNEVAIGLNHRNPHFHDLYRLDLDTGKFYLMLENDRYAKFLVSDALELILKIQIDESDGSWAVFTTRDELFMNLTAAEAFQTEFLSYNRDEGVVYLLDNRFSDMSQLVAKSLSGKECIFGAPKMSDVDEVLFIHGRPKAYASYYEQKKWHAIDETVERDIAFLENKIGPNFEVINCDRRGEIWMVASSFPDKGNQFWVYDRRDGSLKEQQYLEPKNYSNMYSMVVEARDGKKLVCYYTLPKELDKGGYLEKPIPLVVVPHGGPFKVRDRYQFNPHHQWLAGCGYAVLSVNFRLSSGFGKEFLNAGQGEWGRNAHFDVIDGVEALISKGIADREKLAIFGGSYGGYEALVGLTFTPDYFNCGVSIVAPSNMRTVLERSPLFWEFTSKPLSDKMSFYTKQAFIRSVGNRMEECSPLNYVDSIKAPLLLVHGQNDHVVNERESRQIYDTMKKNGKEVTYLLFPDEGHRFGRFPNIMMYMDRAERFLADHLGGKYHPVNPKILEKSSAQVLD